jgi:hypothetical protein
VGSAQASTILKRDAIGDGWGIEKPEGVAMDSSAWTAIEVAVLSFLGAVIGVSITAFFTSRNNNKNIFIGTVTTERAKWRDELRNHTAEFCKLAYGQLQDKDPVSRTRLEELRVLIRLRLNPNPEHALDKTILDAIGNATRGLDGSGVDAREQLETIERNVQALLKQEWEKSKEEARTGKLVSKLAADEAGRR